MERLLVGGSVPATDTVDAQPNAAQAKVDALVAANEKLAAERDEYRKLYLAMLGTCRKLELGIVGQKKEKVATAPGQMSLAVLATFLSEQARGDRARAACRAGTRTGAHSAEAHRAQTAARETAARRDRGLAARGAAGRSGRLREDWRGRSRNRRATPCLAGRGAYATTEVRAQRSRQARRDGSGAGRTTQLPLVRGLAGPGLLADTVIGRWYEHMPLHRLERSYGREGLPLARSTVCGWHGDLAALVKPLLKAMHEDALTAPYLCTDATGVLVQAKDRCGHGHF